MAARRPWCVSLPCRDWRCCGLIAGKHNAATHDNSGCRETHTHQAHAVCADLRCLYDQISRATSALSWRSAHSHLDDDGVSDGDWQSVDLDRHELQSFMAPMYSYSRRGYGMCSWAISVHFLLVSIVHPELTSRTDLLQAEQP